MSSRHFRVLCRVFHTRTNLVVPPPASSHQNAFAMLSSYYDVSNNHRILSSKYPSLTRSISSHSSSASQTIVYSNPRPVQTLALSTLATGQSLFWAYSSYLAHTTPEPLISSAWSFGGLGLSFAFASLIATYLRRSVSHIALIDANKGAEVSVKTHGGGRAILIARDVQGGVGKEGERYWTFRGHGRLFYVVDVGKGVLDLEGVQAVCAGGDKVLGLVHRRSARQMKKKWKEWKEEAGTGTDG